MMFPEAVCRNCGKRIKMIKIEETPIGSTVYYIEDITKIRSTKVKKYDQIAHYDGTFSDWIKCVGPEENHPVTSFYKDELFYSYEEAYDFLIQNLKEEVDDARSLLKLREHNLANATKLAPQEDLWTVEGLAHYILETAADHNKKLAFIDLNLLVYIVYGHYYGTYGKKLFNETFFRGTFGPYSLTLWNKFMDGKNSVYTHVESKNFKVSNTKCEIFDFVNRNLDEMLKDFSFTLYSDYLRETHAYQNVSRNEYLKDEDIFNDFANVIKTEDEK